MTEFIFTEDELPSIAEKIIKILNQQHSKIVLLEGEMGAGKTTLIKEIAKQLGSTDRVSSPTFSLVNEYESEVGPIYHFDFYRIEDENEALDIGLEEYLNDDFWSFIEWPQKVGYLSTIKTIGLSINKIDMTKRKVKFLPVKDLLNQKS